MNIFQFERYRFSKYKEVTHVYVSKELFDQIQDAFRKDIIACLYPHFIINGLHIAPNHTLDDYEVILCEGSVTSTITPFHKFSW